LSDTRSIRDELVAKLDELLERQRAGAVELEALGRSWVETYDRLSAQGREVEEVAERVARIEGRDHGLVSRYACTWRLRGCRQAMGQGNGWPFLQREGVAQAELRELLGIAQGGSHGS
jgi:hypothetical protein